MSPEIEHIAIYRFNVKELAIFTLVQFQELALYTFSGYVGHDVLQLFESVGEYALTINQKLKPYYGIATLRKKWTCSGEKF